MLDLIQAAVLAIVQGLTEFLPISSSAHLILVREFGWSGADDLAFDVAVHVGSLAAVLLYFRKEVAIIAGAFFKRPRSQDARLGWFVVVGTLPIVFAGLVIKDLVADLRTVLVIALTQVVFGLLLWLADGLGKRERGESQMRWSDVLAIALAQALALIPGTSRSGVTMTTGLLVGLTRTASARFSFLLSIPTILAAGTLATKGVIEGGTPIEWLPMLVGIAVSGVSAYLCIEVFLRLVERMGMTPFVIYRLLLGAVLLAFAV
jgi:undecaprenyl-diphosphatase